MDDRYTIYDAVDYIELPPKPYKKRRRRFRPLALLICAAIIALIVFGIKQLLPNGSGPPAVSGNTRSFSDNSPQTQAEEGELPSDLPVSLCELYEKNAEARDFVLGWYEGRGAEDEIDISGDVTDGEIPHFLQWDTRWGYGEYGSDMLAITGCGPTCLSMVLVGLTGDTEQNPYAVARFAEDRGYYAKGAGTSWDFMTDGAKALGLYAHSVSFTEEGIKNALEAGLPIICVLGPGDFTDFGHFIVITGINGDGTANVLDPNSRLRSEKTWELETLMRQIKNLWSYGTEAITDGDSTAVGGPPAPPRR